MTAKDLILAIISEIGVHGGTGHVIEYTGQAIRELDMEGRMTVCNMSIEGGAKAGMIAPDEMTIEYLRGRPFAPTGDDWDKAVEDWRALPTDKGARFDRQVSLDASELTPMITYGTNPGMAVPIEASIPELSRHTEQAQAAEKALSYMGLNRASPSSDRRSTSSSWVAAPTVG